jgi:hypothetical protein
MAPERTMDDDLEPAAPPLSARLQRHATPSRVAAVALVLLALIHLAPLVGVLGIERVEALYGIDVSGPDLELLLRHRAVLFGLVGGYMLWAAWRPAHRSVAFAFAFVNLVGFLALAWRVGDVNAALGKVAIVDAVALAFLAVGVCAHVMAHERSAPVD